MIGKSWTYNLRHVRSLVESSAQVVATLPFSLGIFRRASMGYRVERARKVRVPDHLSYQRTRSRETSSSKALPVHWISLIVTPRPEFRP